MIWLAVIFIGIIYFCRRVILFVVDCIRGISTNPIQFVIDCTLYLCLSHPEWHQSFFVPLLLRCGANVNAGLWRNMPTAWARTIECTHHEGLLERLKHKANPRWRNHKGLSLLHIASQNGNLISVGFLIRNRANVNDQENKDRITPLMSALKGLLRQKPDDIFCCLLLLKENGANINAIDKNGETILHQLARQVAHNPNKFCPFENVHDILTFAKENMADFRLRSRGLTALDILHREWHSHMILPESLKSLFAGRFSHSRFETTAQHFRQRPLGFEGMPNTQMEDASASLARAPSAPPVELIDLTDDFEESSDFSNNRPPTGPPERSESNTDCCICLDNLPETALIPCGHCVCEDCAQELHQCPICRMDIQNTLRIYR